MSPLLPTNHVDEGVLGLQTASLSNRRRKMKPHNTSSGIKHQLILYKCWASIILLDINGCGEINEAAMRGGEQYTSSYSKSGGEVLYARH
jgi:hypothetical protein